MASKNGDEKSEASSSGVSYASKALTLAGLIQPSTTLKSLMLSSENESRERRDRKSKSQGTASSTQVSKNLLCLVVFLPQKSFYHDQSWIRSCHLFFTNEKVSSIMNCLSFYFEQFRSSSDFKLYQEKLKKKMQKEIDKQCKPLIRALWSKWVPFNGSWMNDSSQKG